MLFRVGRVMVNRDVLEDPTITVPDLVSAFERYLQGDWGLADSGKSLHNDVALTSGERIFAFYRSSFGTKFCMTTDSGQTTIFSVGDKLEQLPMLLREEEWPKSC